MSKPTYVFHDAAPQADRENGAMLDALAGLFDPFSRQRLRLAKVRPDARCLVVAVGASCIAAPSPRWHHRARSSPPKSTWTPVAGIRWPSCCGTTS
ncbi:hypothetical protein [Micromonospora craniellae]|uniref:hypothetical protein n=1 Tax=Micromonospora craniellae TaxID=2294034 RepID=UPI001314E7F6|nr:hypothetical protein [Micromonospora craniellae]QOC91264.1 hypothetical protein ID554_25090 [Micromonospora craniellae]